MLPRYNATTLWGFVHQRHPQQDSTSQILGVITFLIDIIFSALVRTVRRVERVM